MPGERQMQEVESDGSERARTLCSEGERLLASGALEAALDAFQGAIDAADACVEGHLGQARTFLAMERGVDAIDSLEVALALDANFVPALLLLARVRRDSGDDGAAIELLRKVVGIAPQRSDALLELGVLLNRGGHTEDTIEVYMRAIHVNPRDPGPRVNLGLIYLQQHGDAQAAEDEFRSALALCPDHVGAAANLGLALHDQGRYTEALECYHAAELAHPDCVEFRWNRAVTELALGDYRNGWEGYALRFARSDGRKIGRFPYRDWHSERIVAGRLLVLAEQGLGDEIMFASCLPDLAAVVDKVVIECSPRLAALFQRSFPHIDVHGAERHASLEWLGRYPDIAAKIAIGSLPRYFRANAAAFVPHAGYLRADPARTLQYRERLQHEGRGACTVGLSWRAGTRATRGMLRSFEFEQLFPLLAIPRVQFVVLQHGLSPAERDRARALGLLVWDDALVDMDGEASLISALDLVISVDNTNVHLAGALGRPTWALLDESPDWRWLRRGQRAPWYPSVRLFRSADRGQRSMIVAEVEERLRELTSVPSPSFAAFISGDT